MKKLYVCGKNSVADALANRFPLEKIVLQKGTKFSNEQIFQSAKVPIEIKEKGFFEVFNNENHQGIVAFLKDFPIYELNVIFKDKPNCVLVLDHIQDPHNFGAIIRTANAFGIKHIIFPKEKAASITPTVLKIASGGFANIKFIKVSSISATLTKLKKEHFWIYVSALEQNAASFDEIQYNYPAALVLGSEGDGVSLPTLRTADQIVYIPQKGTVQSLNVSVAAGLLIHSITKKD
ncbi:23S rRNA (guanosine(2251)-2'-O)-methyltransferase RlmB [Mycoplasmopsis columbinasalis]|uniref:23S rRNA (guanosine(2251)-2'-O)-methyltransferase RlmB n=1 Tax=Mycoplasmopsis columbinasalis TaxID=114880 RepID=UPI00101DE7F6